MADAPRKGPTGAMGDLVKAETMIQLAIALPVGCLVGYFLGLWLDHHFAQHWMAITGLLLGAAGGFIQIFLTASRFMKKAD